MAETAPESRWDRLGRERSWNTGVFIANPGHTAGDNCQCPGCSGARKARGK